ncbi:hypothetical protein ACWHA1_18450 [Streptomyces decoyicus]
MPPAPVLLRTERLTLRRFTANDAELAGLHHVRTFFEEWPDHIEGAEHGDVEYAVAHGAWAAARR